MRTLRLVMPAKAPLARVMSRKWRLNPSSGIILVSVVVLFYSLIWYALLIMPGILPGCRLITPFQTVFQRTLAEARR